MSKAGTPSSTGAVPAPSPTICEEPRPNQDGLPGTFDLETESNRFREAFKICCVAERILPYLGECGRTREERPLFTVDGEDLSND
jgi:hypothetical protein